MNCPSKSISIVEITHCISVLYNQPPYLKYNLTEAETHFKRHVCGVDGKSLNSNCRNPYLCSDFLLDVCCRRCDMQRSSLQQQTVKKLLCAKNH